MPPTIVTLTRFPDLFETLAQSVDAMEPWGPRRIVVTSGGARITTPGWDVVEGIEPFCFARNANIGIAAAGTEDVLLINDDCQLIMPTVKQLAGIANSHACGLLSPQIIGGVGNPRQEAGHEDLDHYAAGDRVCFVCVYLPYLSRVRLGELDEQFTGYGGDDLDYSHRALKAGLTLCVTSLVWVKHGSPSLPYSNSFRRTMTPAAQQESMMEMNALFAKKWGGHRP